MNSPANVTVNFKITRRTDMNFQCSLSCYDKEHKIVGFKVININKSNSFNPKKINSSIYNINVRTEKNAANGIVSDCWILKSNIVK